MLRAEEWGKVSDVNTLDMTLLFHSRAHSRYGYLQSTKPVKSPVYTGKMLSRPHFLLRSNWLLIDTGRRTIILLEGVTLIGFSCSVDVCTKIKGKTGNWERYVGGIRRGIQKHI